MTMADELQKLQMLREQGALTEEEFSEAKRRVLDGAGSGEMNNKQESQTAKAFNATIPKALHGLERSLTDRWIGGVCGGLAASTGIPTWSWRILFILTAFLHGIGILMYVLLWVFVPLAMPQVVVQVNEPPTPSA
jgi:phage shock protein C